MCVIVFRSYKLLEHITCIQCTQSCVCVVIMLFPRVTCCRVQFGVDVFLQSPGNVSACANYIYVVHRITFHWSETTPMID